jgi:hypothetical protein
MLNKLFKSPSKRSTCVALYTFKYDREKTLQLFEFSKEYLMSKLNIEFTYASFFNESYDVKYGKANDIELKLKKENQNDLVNFGLHTTDLKKGLSEFNIEFNFTRPIQLTLQIPDDMGFDVLSFVKGVSTFFYPQYGFVYYPIFDKWSTAYANGDQQHVKSEKGFSSFDKAPLKRWFNECEKITSGFIRDVFELNIMNEKHLDFNIHGNSLRQIITDNSLGDLEQIVDGVYSWTLNKEQLSQTREMLNNSGIFI